MTSGGSLALRQALIAAFSDTSARADAVNALRGSMVWAATWPTDPATLRTLTNSNGLTALAVFSDEQELEEAAIRYAWLGVDGRVPSKHLHMSEVVRFAKQHHAQLLVVDIAAEHALELEEGELELVSALPSARPASSQGLSPFTSSRPPAGAALPSSAPAAASVRPSSPGSASVRPSARPPSQEKLDAIPSTRPPAQSAHKPSSVIPEDPNRHQGVSATFGTPNTGLIGFGTGPSDPLIDALSHVLRDYPEVEWACVLRQLRSGSSEQTPSVGLRIDPAFRKNLNEISVKLRETSIAHGEAFDVLVLDQPDQIKLARRLGRPFYPWRKK